MVGRTPLIIVYLAAGVRMKRARQIMASGQELKKTQKDVAGHSP
jgi:hypothetical protein